uniref:Outer envelope membrane protein 7 n=2 Tax=Populus trichocarpa TaxID=3694 RepID=A0A2K1R7P0_POPTR
MMRNCGEREEKWAGQEQRKSMAAVTSALIAIAGVVLGWIAIEIACKPCLEKGREAIDRSLNPDYDPDDDEIRVPINPPN